MSDVAGQLVSSGSGQLISLNLGFFSMFRMIPITCSKGMLLSRSGRFRIAPCCFCPVEDRSWSKLPSFVGQSNNLTMILRAVDNAGGTGDAPGGRGTTS